MRSKRQLKPLLCAASTLDNQLPNPLSPSTGSSSFTEHACRGRIILTAAKTISLRGQSPLSGRVTVPICGNPSQGLPTIDPSRDACSSSEPRQQQCPAGGANLPPKIKFNHLPVVLCSKASKMSSVSVEYSQIWLKSGHESAKNGFSAKFRPYWVSHGMTSCHVMTRHATSSDDDL